MKVWTQMDKKEKQRVSMTRTHYFINIIVIGLTIIATIIILLMVLVLLNTD